LHFVSFVFLEKQGYVFLCRVDNTTSRRSGNRQFSGFPRGFASIEKVVNCETGFQDLGKLLNLAKIYMKF